MKKKKGFTNYEELIAFLNKISEKHSDKVQLKYIGESQKGKSRPLFTYDQFLSLSHDSISEGSQSKVSEIIEKDLSDMKIISSQYLNKFLDRV